jgi:hypothetical protein
MKSAVGGLIVAVLLFAGGAVCWSEAKFTRQVAESHLRLATLHYDADEDVGSGATAMLNRLPWPTGSLTGDVERHNATVAYWLARYQSLTDRTNGSGPPASDDPGVLFVAANAQFRSSAPRSTDPKSAVERLDGVIQAYADVLRKEPNYADAAYNYEFVARLRDAIAREKPSARAARDKRMALAKPRDVSVDLPAGPTIHGLPGGPPEGVPMSDFKTISPMRYDEREEQMDPGKGKVMRRKG